MEDAVLVLDNGGGFIKAGFAGADAPAAVVPNCLARHKGSKKWMVGDQVEQCDDVQGLALRRPMDRGYLVSTDAEKDIWDRVFKQLQVRPPDCAGLLLVEPLFTLPNIRKNTDELVFEEFGFEKLLVSNAASLVHLYEAQRRPKSRLAMANCSLIVDCGFSFTHAVPVFQGFVVNHAVKRINLGGKALTNHLKELVSYRAWNMMDETYLMEHVKEQLCFCSTDVLADLDVARKRGTDNFISCQYVLPDGVKHKRGFVKDPQAAAAYHTMKSSSRRTTTATMSNVVEREEAALDVPKTAAPPDDQVLTLTNERFMVPEMLFQPADLGMKEAGVTECIVRAVTNCHAALHPLLYSNIVLTGGSSQFPYFKEKLEKELRPLVPDEYVVNIQATDSPITAAWSGGSILAARTDLEKFWVTKQEFEELGSYRCRRKFWL